jgi:chemotaxis protein methyltransferase CheR
VLSSRVTRKDEDSVFAQLSEEEFRLISQLVYQRFGIHLSSQKKTLIVERLQKTIRIGQFDTFRDYYDHVIADKSGKALLDLVDKISTNHTMFFREQDHFTYLMSTLLPRILATEQRSGRKALRIWSAGCSSGEEAYTLAMLLHDRLNVELAGWDVGLLATDISTSVLEKAQSGTYSNSQLDNVPAVFRKRYFSSIEEGLSIVSPELKKLLMFRRLNLMNSEFPFKGQFQLIFCRNVMIYFDAPTREALLTKFHRYLEPGGTLFVGHSESLNRNNPLFRYVRPAVYEKI